MFSKLKLIMLRENTAGQGRHVDPHDPAALSKHSIGWTKERTAAYQSAEMDAFREGLYAPGGRGARAGVLDDLVTFHHIEEAEAVQRCLDWEGASVAEWERQPRDSRSAIAEFYSSVESWSFDLLWYAYLQAAGFGYPQPVIIARHLTAEQRSGNLLDFGSGVGAGAQLFDGLGFTVDLADVSKPLLEFAQFRLDRRGMRARYLDLTTASLPQAHYDVVVAIDTLVLVPDIAQTARDLHAAIKEGGLLFAHYDVRRAGRANAWHLYDDDLPMRYAVERAGFAPVGLIDNTIWIYRRQSTAPPRRRIRTLWSWLRLASPPAKLARRARRGAAHLAMVTARRLLQASARRAARSEQAPDRTGD